MGKAETTKGALLDAAMKVIGHHGYSGATVDDIARAAGVSKGNVYYHFKTKADIATSVLVQGCQNLMVMLRDAAKRGENTPSALLIMIHGFAHEIFENREFSRFLLTELWRDDRLWTEEMRKQEEELLHIIELQIERGVAEGTIRDSIDTRFAAVAITGTVLVAAQYYLMNDPGEGEREFIAHIVDYAGHALSANVIVTDSIDAGFPTV